MTDDLLAPERCLLPRCPSCNRPPRPLVLLRVDRKVLTVILPEGAVITLQSRRPEGFTDDEVARASLLRPTGSRGQRSVTRRFSALGRELFVHVDTGPPTWWLPRVEVSSRRVMAGWLNGMVALSWR